MRSHRLALKLRFGLLFNYLLIDLLRNEKTNPRFWNPRLREKHWGGAVRTVCDAIHSAGTLVSIDLRWLILAFFIESIREGRKAEALLFRKR